MTLDELSTLLQTTGLPVTYRAWPEREAPPLPYLCYLESYSNNFAADGTVYYQISHVQVELYEKLRDMATEDEVESALSSVAFWEKTPNYIDKEECYQILYEIEV